ncbi:FAD-dependent oxidoreductase [Desulfovibrio desulfuricans]|uniref:protoporphyrinogen/coproporphyrinogen oxidase n=1 Tax=Desulfovibrio desulfuricans TaxID=876 RepID=UPI001D05D06D|nr:FAD-dependent oxidoreductase [Desulfovibrio desulfuricans]MCB6543283.1 FAD-dependent oxidoreductase [Desulfovibrio desulfuricans]MCB6554351.1 FAD-dependent oxidoreductase [Desulfovibrio desulfuricans]MCB6566222.1 FAD-dependent oxidoreductase [Desulfovibrio desulfuricans]MCB7347352.1 FAD-dependent oxidoreductase [Desulfovibrio desulfuricans]MCQ5217591.1 FAD-dependent oxidoreductase [Desulfovibrio desulfuricans]
MDLVILGGGLSALSTAYFLQHNPLISSITLLEQESRIGGLCRSFDAKGAVYDVGPHIFFSRNERILSFMLDLLADNTEKKRRSNRILHKNCFVQYPFENDLSKLPEEDIKYCVNAFIHNPYEGYPAKDMLQFFLKTFGEGITNLYLRPYNEKIWKFAPSFMDTQMVERIPKPPKEDILRSANGETVDGYLHQLYFTYPKQGGTETLIRALAAKLNDKVTIETNTRVTGVKKSNGSFTVETSKGSFSGDRLISTIPANLLATVYQPSVPETITRAAQSLRYNSIVIAIANVRSDKAGDNFAFMIADKKVIFHRMSKIDFLGDAYHLPDSTTYMIEITYRKNDLIDQSSDDTIRQRILEGLEHIEFIDGPQDVNFIDIKRFEYAYVIYDLLHRHNMDMVIDHFRNEGVDLLGRFGSFEYLNMDAVIEQALHFSEKYDAN